MWFQDPRTLKGDGDVFFLQPEIRGTPKKKPEKLTDSLGSGCFIHPMTDPAGAGIYIYIC